MKTTANYGLKKPDGTDVVDFQIFNDNADVIDKKLKDAESVIESVKTESISKTTGNITYYINANTGNDSSDGLSGGTAFKTIMKAVNKIPQIVNHNIIIQVESGIYNENIILRGLIGIGSLKIIGDTAVSTTRNINYICIINCSLPITITGFNIVGNEISSISVAYSKGFVFTNMNMLVKQDYGIGCTSSNGYINDSIISNKKHAISAGEMSYILSLNNKGVDNAGSINCSVSTVIALQSQPNGVLFEYGGGKIISGILSMPLLKPNGYRINDDGTIEQWGEFYAVNPNTMYTVALPIAFPSEFLNFTVCSSQQAMCCGYKLNLSQINLQSGIQNNFLTWRAIGR